MRANNYATDNPVNGSDPTGLAGCGSIFIVSTVCNGLQETGVSDAAAGALSTLILGTSTKVAGDAFGFDSSCANFGTAGEIGQQAGFALGALDGEDEAILAEEAGEVAETGATNLSEQLTLEEAEAGAGQRIMQGEINDPDYPEDLWAKMQHVHESPGGSKIVIHYWENLEHQVSTDDLARAAARAALGLTRPDELRTVADAALRDGMDTPSLIALVGADDDESRVLFDRALDDLGVSRPSVREAILWLARDAAAAIVGGDVAPYTGAKQIWDLTLCAPSERIPELDPFIYAASEWEDRPAERIRFERGILSEAQALANR